MARFHPPADAVALDLHPDHTSGLAELAGAAQVAAERVQLRHHLGGVIGTGEHRQRVTFLDQHHAPGPTVPTRDFERGGAEPDVKPTRAEQRQRQQAQQGQQREPSCPDRCQRVGDARHEQCQTSRRRDPDRLGKVDRPLSARTEHLHRDGGLAGDDVDRDTTGSGGARRIGGSDLELGDTFERCRRGEHDLVGAAIQLDLGVADPDGFDDQQVAVHVDDGREGDAAGLACRDLGPDAAHHGSIVDRCDDDSHGRLVGAAASIGHPVAKHLFTEPVR